MSNRVALRVCVLVMVLRGFVGEVRSQEKVPPEILLLTLSRPTRLAFCASTSLRRVRIDGHDHGYLSEYIFKELPPGQRTTHDVKVGAAA